MQASVLMHTGDKRLDRGDPNPLFPPLTKRMSQTLTPVAFSPSALQAGDEYRCRKGLRNPCDPGLCCSACLFQGVGGSLTAPGSKGEWDTRSEALNS